MMSYMWWSVLMVANLTIHTYSVWLAPKVMMEWITWKCGETQDPGGWKHQGDYKGVRCVGMPAVHSDIYVCCRCSLPQSSNQ